MTGRCRGRALFLAGALAVSAVAGPAGAQSAALHGGNTAANARAAALALLDAIDGLAEAERARDRIAALTETIRAHEDGLAALRTGLRAASLRESSIRRLFEQESQALSRVLGAMMAVERIDPPALMLHPQGPLATARAGMMLADLAPAMQAEARRIGALLAELEALRGLQETAQATLSAGLESLQGARIALSQAVADRRDLPENLSADEEQLLALLASVQTLEAFALALDAMPADASTQLETALPAFEAARGTLPLPVRGRVLRRAGEPDAAGIARPGLLLATEPGALVTAPWPATVRYRGPLLDYENVILIEPASGYLLVLAGLGTVFPRVADVVDAGTALGLMPGGVLPGDEFAPADDGLAARNETLYLEMRENSLAIDPAVWFDLTDQ
ncbi:MAG: murein hydrolase activator EnvC family protein [Pararhodobacter sp.]